MATPGRVNVTEISKGLRRAELGRRSIVRRRSKDVAAIVPLADLERLEDLDDLAAARDALKEPGVVTLEDLKRNLGL